LQRGDVLLAIGFRKAHSVTIAFCDKAVAQGAEVLVVTDNSLSELAEKGTVTLYADIDSTFFAHSLVGPVGLVSALAAAVYGRDRDVYDARVRALRDRAVESGWLR
jgi:DNA-binding MurR/RpiR family transcriptional regulator